MTRSVAPPRLTETTPGALALLRQDVLAIGLMLVPLAVMAAHLLYLARIFDGLPELLPLHFDVGGNPDRIDSRTSLLILPAIAVGVNVVNLLGGLLLRLRFGMIFAPYLLWSGALLVQVMLWVALWNIVH